MKLSVIIPIYNSTKYLKQLLASLCNQSFQDFEAIFIDNMSEDKPELYFQNLDKRFKLIRVEKKGVSLARNIGIKEAQGDYIIFIDSDDEISQNYLESLINEATRVNADIVFSSFFIKSQKSIKKIIYKFSGEISGSHNIKEFVTSNINPLTAIEIPFAVRGKCFKAKLIKNIRFHEDIDIGEDFLFVIESLYKAKIIYCADKPNYFYMQNEASALHTYKKNYINKEKKFIEYFEQEIKIWKIKENECNLSFYYYLHYQYFLKNSIIGHNLSEYKHYIKKIRSIKLKKSCKLNRKQKLLNFFYNKIPVSISYKLSFIFFKNRINH